ncbi:hypothetical protein QWA68_016790 [Fusarium oxysporum]|nr:hypothetical protein QWA68_016790 [Fusarium oxysporum]
MKSPDEKAFDQRVQELERRYLPQYIEEVGYIKANWLDPYKERLVRAWVDQHPHFGNVVTSRVEGIHGLLKSHLKKSTLDLFEAWRAMKHALLNQLAELQSNQASQQMRIPIELSGSLYSAIRGWVSHEALRKVEEQRKLLLKEHLPICTGAFSRSHGLPCAHTLKALQEQKQQMPPDRSYNDFKDMPSTTRGAFEATSTVGAGKTIADDIFISIILARRRSSKTNVFRIIRADRIGAKRKMTPVEAQVAAEMERSPFSSRRGMHDIWEAAAVDSEAQQAIHSGR